MFEIKNLTKKYNNEIILNNICYKFIEGNIYVIRGINGSGKSTLFKILAGIINKSSGYITKNKTISYLPDKYVMPSLIRPKTYLKFIYDNDNKIKILLDLYKVDDKLICNLSKGNKQKLGIISKTYGDYDIYIYDEGLDGLDINTKKIFFEELKRKKEDNKIIILSLHEDIYEYDLKEIKLKISDGILYED